MASVRLTSEQVQRLADDVREKIIARQDLVAMADGKIMIKTFRKGQGWDIKLTVTT